jgi:pilus assembly protein Flp/PilA
MLRFTRQVMRDGRDRGASAVEYGLMVAAIAAVVVGIVFALGGVMKGVFEKTCTSIKTGASATAECPTTPAPPANPPAGG